MEKINYGSGYDDTNSIAIVWCIDDVRQVINDYEMDIKLTDEQCMEVLKFCEDNHDTTLGITWETIYQAIEWIYKRKEEE